MQTIKLVGISHPLYPAFKDVYAVSFPVFEQRSELQQEQAFMSPYYHLNCYTDRGIFIGFVAYWEFEKYIYVEHFAIHQNLRGQGYGSVVLKDLTNKAGKRVLLEIDPVMDDISAARLRFYQACGFFENPFSHIHPPYCKDYSGHKLIVLSSGWRMEDVEYEQFAADLRDIIMKMGI